VIKTDHKNLAYLNDQTLQSELQRKAMTKLMGLQFKILYRKGNENLAADALSRAIPLMVLQTCSEVKPLWLQEIVNSYATDGQAQELLAQLAIASPNDQGFSLQQGIIRLGSQIWVGDNSALRTRLINAFHSTVLGGHSRVQATYYRIKKLFQWKGLKVDVENFVKQCSVCQHAKHERTHPAGLLQPLPVPDGAWQDITMDFVEGLPKSEGYSCILVVVDRFLKYAHFIPMKHPFTTPQVAQVVLDVVVRLHGMPKSIISDRDKKNLSSFWRELFKIYNTTLMTSTAYHPQTDGQTERVNQCLEMFLRCCIHETLRKWKAWLPLAELWYNSSFHSSLSCTPFRALYGYDSPVAAAPMLCSSDNKSVQELITERQWFTGVIKQHLAAAQNRIKLQADKHRPDRQFQVGDQVLLKLQPYAQQSVVNMPFPKIAYKFFGPYTVLEKVGSAAYKLDLPDGSMVHPVFHISQLKEFIPDYNPVYSDQPESILERRLVKKGNAAIPQVRVKWVRLPESAST
jgi:hypothetical protein